MLKAKSTSEPAPVDPPPTSHSEPVAIGGIAGSGTRVAAQLLRQLGFYIGDELNEALDNLWFGFLLGRPAWHRAQPAQAPAALRLFGKAMRGRPQLDSSERAILRGAVQGYGEGFREPGRDARAVGRRQEIADSMEACAGPPAEAVGWGWKLPDTYVYLEQLAAAFPGMRYIHLLRDGSELATKAKARRQALAWGGLYGVDVSADRDPETVTLDHCRRANRWVCDLGPRLLGARILLLRYERLCADPRGAADMVSAFLELRPPASLVDEFASFVQAP